MISIIFTHFNSPINCLRHLREIFEKFAFVAQGDGRGASQNNASGRKDDINTTAVVVKREGVEKKGKKKKTQQDSVGCGQRLIERLFK